MTRGAAAYRWRRHRRSYRRWRQPLSSGRLWVDAREGGRIEVATRDLSAVAGGAGYEVSVSDSGSQVTVVRGEVAFISGKVAVSPTPES